jgi:putative signal transducing protein
MFCPQCGSEYREGFFECADCEVALVENPPPEESHPDVDLATVLETSDPALLAIAESLLLEEEIPYLKKGEQIQDLFALGRFPAGFNVVVGPVLLQVPEEHAENAREILEALSSQEATDEEEADEAPE